MAPFDLMQPPLLRATVARLDTQRTLFLLTIHHIVGDGWSSNILYREVLALFEAYCRGAPDPAHATARPIQGLCRLAERPALRARGALLVRETGRRSRTAQLALRLRSWPGARVRGRLPRACSIWRCCKSFRSIATARSTTVSNVVLAIFKLLLFQLTKQRDFCVGLSVANRNHPDLEKLVLLREHSAHPHPIRRRHGLRDLARPSNGEHDRGL